MKNGDAAGGRQALQQALALKSDFQGAADARRVLASLGTTPEPLKIADETITGFCRTGAWFAGRSDLSNRIEWWPIDRFGRCLQAKGAVDHAGPRPPPRVGHEQRDVPLGRTLRDGDDVDACLLRARRRPWPQSRGSLACGRRRRRRSPPAASAAMSSMWPRISSNSSAERSALTTRGASAALSTKQMLFSDEACEIISTLACCAATTSKASRRCRGNPCMPVPLIAIR